MHAGPYATSLVPPLWRGRGVANCEVKPIQTSPEALGWQVAPQPVVRAVPCAVEWAGMPLLMEHRVTRGVEGGEPCLGVGGGRMAVGQ